MPDFFSLFWYVFSRLSRTNPTIYRVAFPQYPSADITPSNRVHRRIPFFHFGSYRRSMCPVT